MDTLNTLAFFAYGIAELTMNTYKKDQRNVKINRSTDQQDQQINGMLKFNSLEEKMNETEKEAWQAFRNVVDGFSGNKRDPKYKNLVKD